MVDIRCTRCYDSRNWHELYPMMLQLLTHFFRLSRMFHVLLSQEELAKDYYKIYTANVQYGSLCTAKLQNDSTSTKMNAQPPHRYTDYRPMHTRTSSKLSCNATKCNAMLKTKKVKMPKLVSS